MEVKFHALLMPALEAGEW